MNIGFDRSKRLFQEIGDLLVVELFKIVEANRLAIQLGQSSDQLCQFLASFGTFKARLRLGVCILPPT